MAAGQGKPVLPKPPGKGAPWGPGCVPRNPLGPQGLSPAPVRASRPAGEAQGPVTAAGSRPRRSRPSSPRSRRARPGRSHRLIRSRQAALGRSLSQSPLTVGSQKAECVRSAAPAAAAAAAMGAPPLPGPPPPPPPPLGVAAPKPAAAHSSAGMKTPGLAVPPDGGLAEPLPGAASTAAGAGASSAAGLSAIPGNAASGTPHQRVRRPERPPPPASTTDGRPERRLPHFPPSHCRRKLPPATTESRNGNASSQARASHCGAARPLLQRGSPEVEAAEITSSGLFGWKKPH